MEWWRKRRLYLQIAIISTLAILMLFFISTINTAKRQVDIAAERLTKDAIVLSKNIAVTSAFQVIKYDLASLEELLLKSTDFTDVLSIRVYDLDGNTLGYINNGGMNPQVIYHIEKTEIPPWLVTIAEYKIISHPDKYSIWRPIQSDSPVGWLYMEFDASGLSVIRNNIWRENITTSTITMVAYLGILLFILRLPMRSLREASDFALQLDSSQGKTLTTIPGSYETQQLIDSLNAASRTLKIQHETIKQAVTEAEKANIAKSRFLANMSHEIRTPMNGVLGSITLLEHSLLNAQQKSLVKTMKLSGRNLLTILNEILDFSKAEANCILLEVLQIDLHALVNHTISNMHAIAKENNVEISCTINNQVPRYILGDSTRIGQVLTNLISNAIKFSPNGSVHIDISHTNEYQKDIIIFSVSDTGIGIEEKDIPGLFQAFTQTDASTTRKYGGTGLGLAICKKLVELMGGSIQVESKKDVGSTFTFSIATQIDTHPVNSDDSPETSDSKVPLHIFKHTELKILVVEDNTINQMIATEFLSHLSLQADIAENGLIAVEAATKKDYDIIFMDIQMPILDGIEATKQIRRNQNGHRPVIIALTANAVKDDVELYLAAGMDDHLAKPIEMEKLVDALNYWEEFIMSGKEKRSPA